MPPAARLFARSLTSLSSRCVWLKYTFHRITFVTFCHIDNDASCHSETSIVGKLEIAEFHPVTTLAALGSCGIEYRIRVHSTITTSTTTAMTRPLCVSTSARWQFVKHTKLSSVVVLSQLSGLVGTLPTYLYHVHSTRSRPSFQNALLMVHGEFSLNVVAIQIQQ